MEVRTAGLLLIRDRKLLLAFSRNKQCYYLPGGKLDGTETSAEALCREIAEELDMQLQPSDLTFYTHISAPAFGESNGMIMEQDCFLVRSAQDPRASAEIAELKYFSLADYLQEPQQAPGAIQILQQLTADQLID